MDMGLWKDAKQIAKRDPAARGVVSVILLYPGFHALIFHRVSHFFYKIHFYGLARWNSQFGRTCTGIEIHPGAKIGHGLFIDHGMGIVVGETAEIGDNCTIYHGVTLGGTGHGKGKRHPTLGNDVLIGAGAKILGPVNVGDNARIGANAVVLHDVPAGATVVGVPGKVVRMQGQPINHADELDHPTVEDPLESEIRRLARHVEALEEAIKHQHPDMHLPEKAEDVLIEGEENENL